MDTPAVERLLHDFNLWYRLNQQAQQRYQAQLAPQFKLLEFLHNDEQALSQYLSMLLDPKGQHGQGELYLKCFLQLTEVQKLADSLDLSTAVRVDTEYCLPNKRRMDIYLRTPSAGLGIENKPWAADQPHQLRDYAEYLYGQFPGGQWLLVYLCNGEVSECSLPTSTAKHLQQRIVTLDFYRLAGWLEDCALRTKALPVRLFVEALVQFVREHINGETSLDNGQELTQLMLRTPENLKAAFCITQHLREVKRQLWRDFLAYLKHELVGLDAELLWDEGLLDGKRHASFSIRFHSTDRYGLGWAFDRASHGTLYFGVCAWDEADIG